MAKDIKQYYQDDHDRLDGLFTQFQELKRTDFQKAKESFKEFMHGLKRHIIWEEEILFPLFEKHTGMSSGGPTQVMRMEHVEIKKHLGAIHDKVKTGNAETDDDEKNLLSALSAHNEKEEGVLYPIINNMSSAEETQTVFSEMEKVKEERYTCRC